MSGAAGAWGSSCCTEVATESSASCVGLVAFDGVEGRHGQMAAVSGSSSPGYYCASRRKFHRTVCLIALGLGVAEGNRCCSLAAGSQSRGPSVARPSKLDLVA